MRFPPLPSALLLLPFTGLTLLLAADQPQWGEAWSRNMVSKETGLPADFDPGTGRNVLWTADLGSETHSSPVVANGRVYIGTNNEQARDPRHQGDRGVLMCFDEKDGKLLWQFVSPKRDEDPFFDWPKSGISSPATVEGDRVYLVSNRGEVLCLDAKGLANGNDGPFQNEGEYITAPPLTAPAAPNPGAEIEPRSTPPSADVKETLEPGPLDADILWRYDMVNEAGIWPHDAAHSSILIRGDHLYLNTGTGVDSTHRRIRRPEAPSLIVLDKRTGRLIARDDEKIGTRVFHCTWSSPTLGKIDGKEVIFFAGGDGILRAFLPVVQTPEDGSVARLEKIWQYDPDPTAPKENVHRFTQNKQIGPSNVFGLPVYRDGMIFLAGGGDLWWGKNEAWLKCIRATGSGDVTESATVWSYPLTRHVMSTPAVLDELTFIADTGRKVHCLNTKTGEAYWTHEAPGDFWASPMVADGKVYIGTRKGNFLVFAASREKQLLAQVDLRRPISATPTVANGTVFVATMNQLFALRKEAPDRP